ncbi:MAG: hypothetical protein OEL87_02670 [Nanoarchaeota archaeon]|nr:hypothetical protein [Nanoarchaeota archaeon]
MERMINLDQCTLNALKLFPKSKLPKIKTTFKNPIIVGSGNAAALGKLLFHGIFANESDYLEKLKTEKIDGCILISASGGKHSPIIAKQMKKKKIKTILLTNNPKGKAVKLVDKTYIFPKNIEPYTYNTSTYLGMILSKTNEDPKKILNFLKKIKTPNLKKYNSYYFIVPEKFDPIREFFETKFDELFGPMIQGKAFTYEETKHAKTIVKSNKELFISLGINNKIFGENKLNYKIPKWADFGLIFCLGYYLIGKIQETNKPWFKENIESYVKEASKIFGEKIEIMS